jgi:hypothetical protein
MFVIARSIENSEGDAAISGGRLGVDSYGFQCSEIKVIFTYIG